MAKRPITVERNLQDSSLTVDSTTLQVHCHLPVGIRPPESGSYVRFWHIPVTVALSEQDILHDFLIGLRTPLAEKTRTYLAPFGTLWSVRFGAMSTELTLAQAADVCDCVDTIGQAYFDAVQEASSLLDIWDYPPVEVDGISGVCVLGVAAWLWPLMLQFSHDFQWSRGESDWHIFEEGTGRLSVCRTKPFPNVNIHAIVDHSSIPRGCIGLVYEYPDRYLAMFEQKRGSSWKTRIGPDGFWSASYTELWLAEHFIPRVISHFQRLDEPSSSLLRERLGSIRVPGLTARQWRGSPLFRRIRTEDRVPLPSITGAGQLSPYVEDLQQWFHSYPVYYLSTDLIRCYYRAFTEVARLLEVTITERDHYLWGYVEGAFPEEETIGGSENLRLQGEEVSPYEKVLHALDLHARRVATHPLEASWQADFLSCAFLWILRNGRGQCPPDRLKEAVQAISPLWDQQRCMKRYRSSR